VAEKALLVSDETEVRAVHITFEKMLPPFSSSSFFYNFPNVVTLCF
jgi:hypothetical protein